MPLTLDDLQDKARLEDLTLGDLQSQYDTRNGITSSRPTKISRNLSGSWSRIQRAVNTNFWTEPSR